MRVELRWWGEDGHEQGHESGQVTPDRVIIAVALVSVIGAGVAVALRVAGVVRAHYTCSATCPVTSSAVDTNLVDSSGRCWERAKQLTRHRHSDPASA